MMDDIVLDASAVIAFLAKEPGTEIVERNLPFSVISTVNHMEIYSYFIRNGYTFNEAKQLIEPLNVEVVDYDVEQSQIAAQLLPKTKALGLSLADRACLALAKSRNLPVMTSDKMWKDLNIGVKIKLFR